MGSAFYKFATLCLNMSLMAEQCQAGKTVLQGLKPAAGVLCIRVCLLFTFM